MGRCLRGYTRWRSRGPTCPADCAPRVTVTSRCPAGSTNITTNATVSTRARLGGLRGATRRGRWRCGDATLRRSDGDLGGDLEGEPTIPGSAPGGYSWATGACGHPCGCYQWGFGGACVWARKHGTRDGHTSGAGLWTYHSPSLLATYLSPFVTPFHCARSCSYC